MTRTLGISLLCILLGMMGLVSFLMKRETMGPEAQTIANAKPSMTPSQFWEEQKKKDAISAMWEKKLLKEWLHKHPGGKMPDGTIRMVPTSTYTESDWFTKRRDGEAGLKELQSKGMD